MILPTVATVAAADRETLRLLCNTAVKPSVPLVEITAAPSAAAQAPGARHRTAALPTPTAGGSSRTISPRRRPRS
jgi:hypothetical protein